jgi:NAD(P)H-dependent flavin oxidoreductase YrpB (nitropropane dioxygenase family)
MITTRLTSRFGLSMPILLAPMDTFSDARLATAVTRAGGLSVLGADYVTTELVTHTSAELRESVENQINSTERLEPSDIAEAVLCMVTQPRRVAVNKVLGRPAGQTW